MHFSQSEFVATLKQANLLTTDQLDYYLIYEEVRLLSPISVEQLPPRLQQAHQVPKALCAMPVHGPQAQPRRVHRQYPHGPRVQEEQELPLRHLQVPHLAESQHGEVSRPQQRTSTHPPPYSYQEQDQGEINQIQQEIQLKNAQYTELNVEYNKTS